MIDLPLVLLDCNRSIARSSTSNLETDFEQFDPAVVACRVDLQVVGLLLMWVMIFLVLHRRFCWSIFDRSVPSCLCPMSLLLALSGYPGPCLGGVSVCKRRLCMQVI
jgi:hypothetical protein